MTNIFRQAKLLLDTKRGDEMSEEDLQLIGTAIIPLMVRGCPFPEDITIGEGLEELANIRQGGIMKIKLLEYEVEVEWISPQPAYLPWHPEDTIAVWFKFKEAVASALSFAINIEARDYTKQEFIDFITVKGEEHLRDIIKEDAERREEALKQDNKRKELNKLTADLGEKLDIPFQLNIR